MDVLTLELRDRKGDVRRALLDQGDAHLLARTPGTSARMAMSAASRTAGTSTFTA